MNTKTKKIFAFIKQMWEDYKLPIVLVSIFIIASSTAMCASCGSC